MGLFEKGKEIFRVGLLENEVIVSEFILKPGESLSIDYLDNNKLKVIKLKEPNTYSLIYCDENGNFSLFYMPVYNVRVVKQTKEKSHAKWVGLETIIEAMGIKVTNRLHFSLKNIQKGKIYLSDANVAAVLFEKLEVGE